MGQHRLVCVSVSLLTTALRQYSTSSDYCGHRTMNEGNISWTKLTRTSCCCCRIHTSTAMECGAYPLTHGGQRQNAAVKTPFILNKPRKRKLTESIQSSPRTTQQSRSKQGILSPPPHARTGRGFSVADCSGPAGCAVARLSSSRPR